MPTPLSLSGMALSLEVRGKESTNSLVKTSFVLAPGNANPLEATRTQRPGACMNLQLLARRLISQNHRRTIFVQFGRPRSRRRQRVQVRRTLQSSRRSVLFCWVKLGDVISRWPTFLLDALIVHSSLHNRRSFKFWKRISNDSDWYWARAFAGRYVIESFFVSFG